MFNIIDTDYVCTLFISRLKGANIGLGYNFLSLGLGLGLRYNVVVTMWSTTNFKL